jgi:hypothetical protein
MVFKNPNAPPPTGQLPTQAALAAAAATARVRVNLILYSFQMLH